MGWLDKDTNNSNKNTMNVLDELREINSKIKSKATELQEMNQERIKWAKENRKRIKDEYPKKGEIYALKRPYQKYWHNDEEVLYVKVVGTRFVPHRNFEGHSYAYREDWDEGTAAMPTFQGVELNSEFIEISGVKSEFSLSAITDTDPLTNDRLKHRLTKIYVMFDKNTGYYKIGRSKNPKKRHKTLRVGNPNIELLFFHDGRIRDERRVQAMFEDKKVHGEWYNLNGKDLTKIKEYFRRDST